MNDFADYAEPLLGAGLNTQAEAPTQSATPVFTPSTRLRLISIAGWVVVAAYIVLALVGGYMIVPGLAMLVGAYILMRLAAGLTDIQGELLKREINQFFARQQQTQQSSQLKPRRNARAN